MKSFHVLLITALALTVALCDLTPAPLAWISLGVFFTCTFILGANYLSGGEILDREAPK